jgi:hypothetical protein
MNNDGVFTTQDDMIVESLIDIDQYPSTPISNNISGRDGSVKIGDYTVHVFWIDP